MRVLSYDEDSIEEHEPSGVDEIRSLMEKGRTLWIDVRGKVPGTTMQQCNNVRSIDLDDAIEGWRA